MDTVPCESLIFGGGDDDADIISSGDVIIFRESLTRMLEITNTWSENMPSYKVLTEVEKLNDELTAALEFCAQIEAGLYPIDLVHDVMSLLHDFSKVQPLLIKDISAAKNARRRNLLLQGEGANMSSIACSVASCKARG